MYANWSEAHPANYHGCSAFPKHKTPAPAKITRPAKRVEGISYAQASKPAGPTKPVPAKQIQQPTLRATQSLKVASPTSSKDTTQKTLLAFVAQLAATIPVILEILK